ncbi:MAG: Bax inhibitor-1/YccA family protein [Planctomycetota bacterium]|jgi:FtsH-binding integral membrane protein|nr:Bax inhibitor-1/YccA family protein [Planctomycetota bacterium]
MYDDAQVAYPEATMLHPVAANRLLRSAFLWMFIGLVVTTAAAMVVAGSQTLLFALFENQWLLWGLLISEISLVVVISAAINRLSAGTATFLFLLYSAINGITLSSIFIVYAYTSVIQAFAAAGCLFAAMSIFGYFTQRDLTSWGNLLFIGLIAVLVSTLINFLVGSDMFGYVVSVTGILVFLCLTAYDTQKILHLGASLGGGDSSTRHKAAIVGALKLYLDFINLLLFLLRLFGRARD